MKKAEMYKTYLILAQNDVNVLQTEYNNLKSDLSLIDLQQQLKVLKEKWKLTENVLRKLARRNSNDQRKKIKKLRLSLTNKLRVYLKCDKSTQIWSYSNKGQLLEDLVGEVNKRRTNFNCWLGGSPEIDTQRALILHKQAYKLINEIKILIIRKQKCLQLEEKIRNMKSSLDEVINVPEVNNLFNHLCKKGSAPLIEAIQQLPERRVIPTVNGEGTSVSHCNASHYDRCKCSNAKRTRNHVKKLQNKIPVHHKCNTAYQMRNLAKKCRNTARKGICNLSITDNQVPIFKYEIRQTPSKICSVPRDKFDKILNKDKTNISFLHSKNENRKWSNQNSILKSNVDSDENESYGNQINENLDEEIYHILKEYEIPALISDFEEGSDTSENSNNASFSSDDIFDEEITCILKEYEVPSLISDFGDESSTSGNISDASVCPIDEKITHILEELEVLSSINDCQDVSSISDSLIFSWFNENI